jgi:hypothetical protein
MQRRFYLYTLFFTFSFFSIFAQGRWTEHVSFNQIVDVAQIGDLIFGASSQALMIYDKATGEIERFGKQAGLSDIGIVALDVYPAAKQLIIGYENGNIDLYRNGRIINISDISRSTLFLGNRRMNHLRVHGDRLFVSMGFGIVVVDLSERLVRETYVIGPQGSVLEVNQVAIDEVNNFIYAGTPDGLYRASLSSPLTFFQSWSRVSRFGLNDIPSVTVFNDEPVVCQRIDGTLDSIFRLRDDLWLHIDDFVPQTYTDVRASQDLLIGVHSFGVRAFNKNFGMIYNITSDNINRPDFQPFKAVRDTELNRMWIATLFEGLAELNPFQNFIQILPEGPKNSRAYSLFHNGHKLFVATAALTATFTETFDRSGIFAYSNFQWGGIRPDQLNEVNDIVAVCTHPDNPNHVFASSWGGGLLELLDGVLINEFNASNTANHGLTKVNNSGSSIRAGWMDFDSKGNLWVVTSQNDSPLSVRRVNGTWETFSLGSAVTTTTIVQRMMVTSRDQIWVQMRSGGVIVAQENASGGIQIRRLTETEGQGNLPSNIVNAFDEDRNGAIWLGTGAGVAVIFNPANIFDSGENFDAVRITFEEDGVVQALLSQENVTCVKVDGANQKWFGTSFRGAFYTSSDGRQEIHAFNQNNSPLPSNTIFDIEVDPRTGEVFFATPGGVSSYQGTATQGNEFFEEPYAFPNPVRPGYEGLIYIRNLVSNAQVKITDLNGNLVYETTAQGGQAVWDGKGFHGQDVAAGVYTAFMNDRDGFQTAVVKILIVR